MWIEINICLQPNPKGFLNILLNSNHVTAMQRTSESDIAIRTHHESYALWGEEIQINAVWNALQIALTGQEVNLDEWGYIRPLINYQQEALHKYMLYKETISRMAKDVI